ncbi:hypothetical protein CI238_09001, partial [Colletotrichum incanum]
LPATFFGPRNQTPHNNSYQRLGIVAACLHPRRTLVGNGGQVLRNGACSFSTPSLHASLLLNYHFTSQLGRFLAYIVGIFCRMLLHLDNPGIQSPSPERFIKVKFISNDQRRRPRNSVL